jgi:IclR family mhp operon transcriptional activator
MDEENGNNSAGGMLADSGVTASRTQHRMPPGHPTPVRVLLRGLELIQVLNRHGALTTAALSQKLRLARTTVNRCLATLEATGFVERLSNRRYQLTLKAVTLSHGYDAVTERLDPVRAALHASAVRVQWPMSLMRPSFPEMFIEDSTDRESGFAVEYFERGMRVPVLTTASGRAWLAYASPRVRETVLEHLWPNRPVELHSLWPDRAALERELDTTRERGYARATRPLRLTEQGSIAVPIMVEGEPVAALAVRFALSAVSFDDARKKLLPALQEIALGRAVS